MKVRISNPSGGSRQLAVESVSLVAKCRRNFASRALRWHTAASALLVALATVIAAPAFGQSQPLPKRVVIIKADDMRGRNGQWDAFLAMNKEKGVKASIGIICNSLEAGTPDRQKAYKKWLQELDASGEVEFWHHGWDHKRWTDDNNRKLSEYGGSGYEHQKEHTTKAQEAGREVFGKGFNAIGTPYNAIDKDSVRVFKEMPELQMVFVPANHRLLPQLKDKVLLPMTIRGEHDGVAKPNFEKFKADYDKLGSDVTFIAFQVHPPFFKGESLTEYGKIIDLLKADGWEFLLPREYLAQVQAQKAKAK